jgi:Fur family ferric uptake transcriptional regulator
MASSSSKAAAKRASQAPALTGHAHAHPVAKPAAKLGQRQTRQRGVIAAILDAAQGPLTIPEIHAQALHLMKAEPGSNVGIATVYRTLNLLVENQRAQAVILPSGDTRYEAAGHKGHHDHFQCLSCGKAFDIDVCLLGLPHGFVIPGGFQVEGHELTLTGQCPACAARPKKAR